MNPKIILCLALVLSGVSVFALAYSLQIKPGDPHPDIIIRSWSLPGDEMRSFQVFVMPDTNNQNQFFEGRLEVNATNNHIASCPIAALNVTTNSLNPIEREYFRLFKLPAGAKVFRFEVATNFLDSSKFLLGYDDFSEWFYLRDFATNSSNAGTK
jgi:hypothetical protein